MFFFDGEEIERGEAEQDSIQCSFIIQYLHTIVVQRRYNPL